MPEQVIEIAENAPSEVENKKETAEEVEKLWSTRRTESAAHRKQFETIWDSGIRRFFEGILKTNGNGAAKLYDSLYEQYDLSIYSSEGLRFGNLQYPLLHTIVLRALASEFTNRPSAKFISIGSNDPSRAVAFTHYFNQVLSEANADQEDFEVMLDRRIRGSAAVLQLTEKYERTVKDPTFNPETKELTYEVKSKKIVKTRYRKIDLRNLYLDPHCKKTDLSDCGYAIADEWLSKEDFAMKYAHLGEQRIKEISTMTKDKDSGNPFLTEDSIQWVCVSHCFDPISDTYNILGNGKLINEANAAIPRIAGKEGKAIPIALAIMYKIPDCPYGYGDAHVTTAFNSIKNLARLMILEITQKMAKPTIFVDPASSFDEQTFEWGQDFARVSPDDIKEMSINPNMDMLNKLDDQTDNDIIRATGININDTTNIDTNETARKTVIRKESQNAITELGMSFLSITFFKRVYELLKDDIRLHSVASLKAGDKIQVKTKDVKLKRIKNGFKEYSASGFRYFDLKPEDIDMDMEIVLEVGNISTSKQLEKAIKMEALDYIQVAAQGFSQEGLARYIQELCEMPETVLASKNVVSGGDPEAVANEGLDPAFLPQAKQMQSSNQTQNVQATQGVQPVEGVPQAGGAGMEQAVPTGGTPINPDVSQA